MIRNPIDLLQLISYIDPYWAIVNSPIYNQFDYFSQGVNAQLTSIVRHAVVHAYIHPYSSVLAPTLAEIYQEGFQYWKQLLKPDHVQFKYELFRYG